MVRAVVAGGQERQRLSSSGPISAPTFEPVTAQIAESLGMARPDRRAGLRRSSPDGPAAKAGLKPGDVVLAMNGAADRACRRARLPAGDADDRQRRPSSTVLSQGEREDASRSTLVRAPEGASAAEVTIGGRSPFAGAKVAELSPRLAQRLGLPADTRASRWSTSTAIRRPPASACSRATSCARSTARRSTPPRS